MAQPVRQVAIRSPGFQGLNTELSPINGDPEFALVADNVVVDQVGRLASRKAFSDFARIDSDIRFKETADITTSSGIYGSGGSGGSGGVEIIDNVAKLAGLAPWPLPAGYTHDRVIIKGVELDEFNGRLERTTYKLSFSVSFVGKSTELIPDTDTAGFPGSVARMGVSGTGTYTYIRLDFDKEDGLSMPDGTPAHRFHYYPEATPSYSATVEFDPEKDLTIGFTFNLPRLVEYEMYVSIDSLEMDGYLYGERGHNEIITLGKDVIGIAPDSQTQSNFRPVFIYRWGDGYDFPGDARLVPVGMGRQKVAQRNLPELSGDIQYAIGTCDAVTNKTYDFGLPSDYENECLLTAQFVNFSAEDLTTGNDRLLLFAKDKPFLRLDNDDYFTVVDAKWINVAGAEYPIDGDIAISAYGRVWVSGVGGDYHKIHYSGLLNETMWYDGRENASGFNDAGFIDVREYWPVDGDTIVNIHAHNGFLIVFGRNSILVYANANTGNPAGENGIQLQDAISNVGLVRRDAICNIGTDVLFVDDSGVRSIGRVIQEKSSPVQEPSLNIRREIQSVIKQEIVESPSHSAIRLEYMPSESLAVLLFASLKLAYVFHLNMPSKTGGLKVTRWTNCFWNDSIELKQDQEDVVLLAGKPDKGLLRYSGYLEGDAESNPEPYIMRYESMALALGQSPMQTVIPKSVHYNCMGEYIPGQANALWGFADRFIGSREFQIEVEGGSEYNVSEFSEDDYVDGGPYYKGYKINTTGSGELFRVGFEVKVQGGRYALQEININSASGRITA